MNVTSTDLIALLPLLILAGAATAVMLGVAVRRSHLAAAVLSFIGLAASFVSLWMAAGVAPRQVTPLLVMDQYAIFYIGLILAATMAVVLFSYGYFEKCEGNHEELYILMLVATLGSAVLVASNHFASLFLGLELLSVALYGMISYLQLRPLPVEAGIKYLVLAATSAAFLLFGMALIYAALGTMEFNRIAEQLAHGTFSRALVLPGFAVMVTGFGFKLAVVPFHLWTPDVYEGAPAPVTAFIATVSKGAMFALLLRFFRGTGAHSYAAVSLVFTIIAIASMFTGNILALLQNNVKRMLAYSSIAHLGYVLVAFQAGGVLGPQAVTFYLVAYFVTTLGAFGVVTLLSSGVRDADELEDYRGLFWRRPALAGVFTAMLLSLAGIPLTAGFAGKFFVVAAGASAATWALIVILVVTSAIGLYYYLRIIVVMYGQAVEGPPLTHSLAPAGGIALGIITVALIFLGVQPGPLLDTIRSMMASVV
jgi:NADH-quinone oxidoreductase subunit N